MRAWLFCAAVIAACQSRTETARSTTPQAAAPTTTMGEACPIAVEGTQVTVDRFDGGIALVFVTTGDATELRTRVQRTAALIEGQHGAASAHDTHRPAGHVPTRTTVIEIDRGARLELRPVDPGQLDALRAHTEMHAAQMARGECPTEHEHPT